MDELRNGWMGGWVDGLTSIVSTVFRTYFTGVVNECGGVCAQDDLIWFCRSHHPSSAVREYTQRDSHLQIKHIPSHSLTVSCMNLHIHTHAPLLTATVQPGAMAAFDCGAEVGGGTGGAVEITGRRCGEADR